MFNQKERIIQFEKRVFAFSRSIIIFSRKVSPSYITKSTISQLIRSGTSIGANYMEANSSQSTKDFIHKAEIARKEARETDYWLSILKITESDLESEICQLKMEVMSIYRILGSMCKKSKQRLENKKNDPSRV